jgi:large conductance mechanosensitive channel
MAKAAKPEQEIAMQIVHTDDGDVHISQPKGHKGHRPNITVLLESDDIVRNQARGFMDFLREYAVVGLAVGFIIGLQAQVLIKQLVDSFVTPFISLLVGEDLMDRKWVLYNGGTPIEFTWGMFLYVFINFLFVLLFIYIIIKVFKLDKLQKSKKKK